MALPVHRQVASSAGRGLIRILRRRATTEATPTPSPPSGPSPKKSRSGFLRRLILYSTAAAGTFYVGSAFLAFNNQRYYDIFSNYIPLGRAFLEFAEQRDWDILTPQDVVKSWKATFTRVQQSVTGKTTSDDKLDVPTAPSTPRGGPAKPSSERYQETKQRVQDVISTLRTRVEKTEDTLSQGGAKVAAIARHHAVQFSEGVEELIREAEAALAGKYPDVVHQKPEHGVATATPASAPPTPTPSAIDSRLESLPQESQPPADVKIYDAPLPLGFELPPGFTRPVVKQAPKAEESAHSSLPRIVQAVSDSPEGILVHLASTVDELASLLESSNLTASETTNILEAAKTDLTKLAARFEEVKGEERRQMEAELDEKMRQYSQELTDFRMEIQDQVDEQVEDLSKLLYEQRASIIHAYREKLMQELMAQNELINERLKEELIVQGIEMQRRWIREIKVHVEQERGGRLAKLDELAANLKRLERVTLDNSSYLDDSIRIHALWSGIRALNSVINYPKRTPFREELRVLRHIAAAREDAIVSAALDSLDASDVPDIGVEPFADLASWFSTSVAPRVAGVALVPEQNAGLLSHLVSQLLSSFTFKRQGMVEGADVLSVLARAESFLNEKDLDGATRELNQLKGTARILLKDWLDAARRRLEVEQALEVVKAQATLASILVI